MANKLSWQQMFEVYELIGSYIPKEDMPDVFDYIKVFWDNCSSSTNGTNRYIKALSILSGKSAMQIFAMGAENSLILFIKSLRESGFDSFREFMESFYVRK